eukprot:8065085-Alexandrium_andersonii.AAC.1
MDHLDALGMQIQARALAAASGVSADAFLDLANESEEEPCRAALSPVPKKAGGKKMAAKTQPRPPLPRVASPPRLAGAAVIEVAASQSSEE